MRAPRAWSCAVPVYSAQKSGAIESDGARAKSSALYSNGTNSNATILMILINGLMAGPAVSL
jgi:hypothetical protein